MVFFSAPSSPKKVVWSNQLRAEMDFRIERAAIMIAQDVVDDLILDDLFGEMPTSLYELLLIANPSVLERIEMARCANQQLVDLIRT